jgi:DNA-binding response OmpR family regulator
MPKKSGKDAYREIKALKPSVKALFCSGYDVDLIGSKGLLVEGVSVLLKPTAPTELLRSVRMALDSSGTAPSGRTPPPD